MLLAATPRSLTNRSTSGARPAMPPSAPASPVNTLNRWCTCAATSAIAHLAVGDPGGGFRGEASRRARLRQASRRPLHLDLRAELHHAVGREAEERGGG